MERIGGRLSYANVAATLALLFAMSGGAIAATGGFSSGGTLRACANEEGRLKLLSTGQHCKKGQKAVAWNQAGAPGAKGATGAAGSPGASGAAGASGQDGARGPSTAFSTNSGTEALSFPSPANEVLAVSTLSLPAGSFDVLGKVLLNNNASSEAFARCELLLGSTVIDPGFDGMALGEEGEGSSDRQYIVLTAAGSLASPASASIRCKVTKTQGVYLDRSITAIQVGGVG